MPAAEQLSALIEEAYRLFAPCRAAFPLAICECDCCSPQDFQHELLRFPCGKSPKTACTPTLGSVPSNDEAATARSFFSDIFSAQAEILTKPQHAAEKCTEAESQKRFLLRGSLFWLSAFQMASKAV